MFRSVRLLYLAILAGVLVSNAKANIGFQPVSQEELKMTGEPAAPGAAAIILYREVDRDDNTYTSHEDNYFRIKILKEEGRKRGDVEIPFFKGEFDVVAVKGRTIRPDGTIAEFDGKVFEKELVKGRAGGRQFKYLAKAFTLPDVQVGSVIEYAYTIDFKEHLLFDSHWILSDELFTKNARFTMKPYSGNSWQSLVLHWNWQHLPPGTAPPKKEPNGIIHIEASNIPAFEEEDHMPPPDELKARVDFYWEDALQDKDAASYWKRIGKKWNGDLESIVGKRGAMERAVAEIVSPNDPPEAKLRKIYDRVQQLRNTSYEIQKTEQEQKRAKLKEVDNANVEEIWKRGYGNGIQLTWLYLGLVRAAGFEAYGCWVASRNEYFFNPNSMQSRKLNSNVVLVKLNGKDMYFDPGGAFTPFGLLVWPETGVAGLRLDKDGGTWIQTILPAATKSQIQRAGKFNLTDTGELQGKLTITYTGLEALYHRLEVRHDDDVERKKYMEERAISEIGVGAVAELTNKPDWTSSETPLVAEFDLKIPGWASSAGRRVMIPAAIFTAGEKGVFDHTNRVHPIYFDYPNVKADDITIDLPLGWHVSSLPSGKDQDGHVVRYTMKAEKTGETLHLTRTLTIDAMGLDVKYYGALREFFQGIRTGDAEQIMLQPGDIHASN